MHGALRFCLATLVVLSHLGRPGPVNVGIAAVVVFYMLAGYVVTHLLQKHFPPGRLGAFYAERFLRIYPLYLLCLAGVSVFLFTTGFGPAKLTPLTALANLAIIPLNFYMFSDFFVIRGFAILPTAWSLGAEMQAYAILPLIIRSQRAKWIVGLFSLLVFTASASGLFNADTWGYRLLPGILFVFLTGSAISKTTKTPDMADRFDRVFPYLCWTWLLFLLIGLGIYHRVSDISATVMLGFLLGMPMVMFTSTSKIRIPCDDVLGRISYGLFLIHIPVSWLAEYLFSWPLTSIYTLLFVMGVSVALSVGATFTVERLAWPLRKSITSG